MRACLRAEVPALEDDRYFAPDMAKAFELVRSNAVVTAAGLVLPAIADASEDAGNAA